MIGGGGIGRGQNVELPISLMDVSCCQHVIKLHDPDTPWHLQVIRDLFITACGK